MAVFGNAPNRVSIVSISVVPDRRWSAVGVLIDPPCSPLRGSQERSAGGEREEPGIVVLFATLAAGMGRLDTDPHAGAVRVRPVRRAKRPEPAGGGGLRGLAVRMRRLLGRSAAALWLLIGSPEDFIVADGRIRTSVAMSVS